jgi:hypothetical protein
MAQQPEELKGVADPFILKLPHPYLTSYAITNKSVSGQPKQFQISLSADQSNENGIPPPATLHHDSLSFSDIAFLEGTSTPAKGDNSSWARARRAPYVTIAWSGDRPSIAQLWLVAYALISQHPFVESMRVLFSGNDAASLTTELFTTGLFHPHPKGSNSSAPHDGDILLRSTFWQGAASPFGARPAWAPHLDTHNKPITAEFPPFPFQTAPSTVFPALPRHTMHPVRRPKPAPGSVIYSRWIPHLQEHFTMIALDYNNDDHLRLFNKWQNDPRVAAGWNETGTLDQHREYLRKLHEDPHVMTMFAAFDNVLFAYFEVYWAMVSASILLMIPQLTSRRRTTWVHTSSHRPMTVGDIRWSATSDSEDLTESPLGGLGSCTTCSWTSHVPGTWWASLHKRAVRFSLMILFTVST